MKNILVTVGNGFDLAANMQTSYSKFVEWLIAKYATLYSYLSDGFVGFVNHKHFAGGIDITLTPDIDIWSLLFICFAVIEKKKPACLPMGIEEWKDVEELMFRLITVPSLSWEKVFRFTQQSGHEHSHRYSYVDLFKRGDRDLSLLFFATAIDELPRLKQKADFLMNRGFDELAPAFLLGELRNFEAQFGDFVVDNNKSPESRLLRKKMLDAILADDKNENVFVDSFNYCEEWYASVRYINGCFKEPIFGVDESLLSRHGAWMSFSKGSRRLFLNESRMIGNRQFVSPDILVVFGHSLNKQDYAYFFNIFDSMHLTDASYKTKVVFAYNEYDEKHIGRARRETANRVIALFNAYDERNKRLSYPLHTLTQLEVCGRIAVREVHWPDKGNDVLA